MSLPKRLYNLYKEICGCELVTSGSVTTENLADFQNLVNDAQATSPNAEQNELVQQEFTRSLYYSNPVGFYHYVSNNRNRVSALILWTESKRIVKFFNLHNRVHLSWNPDTKLYLATPHVPRQNRQDTNTDSTEQSTEQQTSVQRGGRQTRGRSFRGRSNRGRSN